MKDFELFIGKILRFKWDPKKDLKNLENRLRSLRRSP